MKKIVTKALLSAGGICFMSISALGVPTKFLPNTYVALSKAGMNNAAKTYYISTSTTPSSSAFTISAPFTLPYNVNGIGLNAADSLLYGATYVGADNTIGNSLGVSLYKVGANGEYVDMGLLPTPGQNGLEFVNFSAGTIQNGAYYYLTYGFTPTGMAKLANAQANNTSPNLTTADINGYLCWLSNVATLTPNPGNNVAPSVSGYYQLDFSSPEIDAALQSFLDQVNSNYPDIFNADGGIQDIDINPANGLVYAYISYPQGGATVGRPVVFNTPVAGVSAVSTVGSTVNTAPGQEIAGMMFDPGANLYGLFTTGDYAGIDLSTGTLTSMAMSNLPTSGGNLRGDLATAFVATVLPVDILSFTATANRSPQFVSVHWETASENNLKGYKLLHSADAHSWKEIATINAQSLSHKQLTYKYNFKHAIPDNGTNYYQLAQVDIDGTVNYSNIISVNMNNAHTTAIQVYPNPAENILYIQGNEPVKEVYMYNMQGQKMLLPFNSLHIDISSLMPGSYIIDVITSSGTSYKQAIVKKK